MGATHFLTKGLERVKTEMSLHVLAFNFGRLLILLGIPQMLAAIRAFARFLLPNGLLVAYSLLVLPNTRKWIATPVAFPRTSGLAWNRTIPLTDSVHEFLHGLGR